MKVISEIVHIFYEDNRPVGFLLLNGHAEFFKITKANKEFISELLGSNKVEEEK